MEKSIAKWQGFVPRAQKAKPQPVETVGSRVAHARRLLGVTSKADILPTDLARMVGVPASTISRVENGERQPGEDLVQKLAAVLGVTPSYIRYGEGEGLRMHDAMEEAADAGHARTGRTKGK